MNILSWNVNGIRAFNRKGLLKPLFLEGILVPSEEKPVKLDIIGFQETKATYLELSGDFFPEGYTIYHNSAKERKGYSGTVLFVSNSINSKLYPINVSYETLLTEGRVLCVELDDFILINCYFPNGGGKDHRLDYKLRFYDEFTGFCKDVTRETGKELIFFGDLNIAHTQIDLARPKENENKIGFLPEEREKLDVLNKDGFLDMFRVKHPEVVQYTWWDMKTRSRERNVGWRIDSFYSSQGLLDKKQYKIKILDTTQGSDHCPVFLSLED